MADGAAPLDSVNGCFSSGFDIDLLGCVFPKSFGTVKIIPPKRRLGFARVFLQALDAVLASSNDISTWV